MYKLTAFMVFAIFKALDLSEKEIFIELINNEDIKPKERKLPEVYKNLPIIFHPGNEEMFIAEIMHGK